MMGSNERLVVNVNSPFWAWCWVRENETDEEALKRAEDDRTTAISNMTKMMTEYPGMKDYFTSQISKLRQASYVVTDEDHFQELHASYFLSKPAVEITEEKYEEMLGVLPPLHYVERHGVTEFCMSEFLSGSFTNQYAYDKRTGKYWTKIVDACDVKTWLDVCIPG